MIFQLQTRMIQWILNEQFEFVFPDAPWECGPGPGVVPVFEGMGPFYRWARTGESEREDRLGHVLRRTLRTKGGPWVGVLGFSQGGRLAAGLLLEFQQGKLQGLAEGLDFKFGLFFGASYPLLLASNGGFLEQSQKEHLVPDEKLKGAISIPSVHVMGLQDGVLPMSELLAQCFDSKTSQVFHFDIGHFMPKDPEHNRKIKNVVLELYGSSCDEARD